MSSTPFNPTPGQTTRFEGRLVMWNPERGFGAIQPVQGGQELFVHISAFPTDGEPPVQEELLSFEVVSDGVGRKRATRVQRLQQRRPGRQDVPRALSPSSSPRAAITLRRRREERRRALAIAIAGLAVAVGMLGWSHFKSRQMQEGAATLVAQGGAPR